MNETSKSKTAIISLLIPLIAISVVFLLGYRGFGWEKDFKNKEVIGLMNFFFIPDPLNLKAWQVFENYLKFAKTHDLAGLRNLSYQISPTCNDHTKEQECNALMDSVYFFASNFKISDFTHFMSDERQIVMYTDGPTVAILFFTRDEAGTPKVLGMRFCFEDETVVGTCVDINLFKRDLNGNGWWDNVESLFYK